MFYFKREGVRLKKQSGFAEVTLKQDRSPLGTINLMMAAHVRAVDIKAKSKLYCFQVQTPSRTYYMGADCTEERQRWVEILNNCLLELHPPPVLQTKVGAEDFELLKLVGKGTFFPLCFLLLVTRKLW